MLGDVSEDLLHRGELLRMPENLTMIQAQIKELFANVLDADEGNKTVEERLTTYYRTSEDTAFQFRPFPLSYELLNGEVFTEVLCPETIYGLIDYHLRECIKREVKMRVCKNCGRYFAVTGHGGVEYCDRICDDKGHTCREVGAIAVWTKKRSTDDVFKAYRREYKKRFAWIKSGKISQEEFYAWSAAAREKKTDCEAGRITQEEFTEWLSNS